MIRLYNKVEYQVCERCACGVANDDWTHLDYIGSDDLTDRIFDNLEEIGFLEFFAHNGDHEDFRCAVCEEYEIDASSVLFMGKNPDSWASEVTAYRLRLVKTREALERVEISGNPGADDIDRYRFEALTASEQQAEIERLRLLLSKTENKLQQLRNQ